MNEDKAINEATKFVQKYRDKEQKFYDYLFSMKENDIPIQAIETILDLYQKEKEKNKEITIKNHALKNESNVYGDEIVRLNNKLQEKQQEIEYLNCIIESDNDNYINKNKIREKIESIENMSEVEVCDEGINYRLKIEDKAKIKVLKELLEEN